MKTPLVFTPHPVPKVWGGGRLSWKFSGAGDLPIGESLEVSDLPDAVSVVHAGRHVGKTLHDLFDEDPSGLCGDNVLRAGHRRFPLLLKLISTADLLSVQVHPDNDYIRGLTGPHAQGKDEAWYILDAAPGAFVYVGLTVDINPGSVRALIADGLLKRFLNKIPVKPGDYFNIPAGTIHALGRDILLAEIQQTSDVTYRFYDWDRRPPRELHLENAIAVADLRRLAAPARRRDAPDGGRAELIRDRHFAMSRICLEDGAETRLDTGGGAFHILTVASGAVRVSAGGETVRLGALQSCLVPAAAGKYALACGEGGATVLLFHV